MMYFILFYWWFSTIIVAVYFNDENWFVRMLIGMLLGWLFLPVIIGSTLTKIE